LEDFGEVFSNQNLLDEGYRPALVGKSSLI
jgi:hypothetical protein